MLFGDDLGDFLPCVRPKALWSLVRSQQPQRAVRSWFAITQSIGAMAGTCYPVPMHGSWTSMF